MHNIEYYDYKEDVDKRKVFDVLNDYVERRTWEEGGGGIGRIRWNEVLCENYDEAQKWIESHDSGWYDCLAVKFKSPIQEKEKSAKLKELDAKIKETYEIYDQRSSVLYPKTRTSEYIGCAACGSRLASKHLCSNKCPVCHADLRPETMLKSIATAKAKWDKAQEARKEYVAKHSKKEIRWLVKIEYHT